jgi:glycosyltransferase involved in cell wall biosynthesis
MDQKQSVMKKTISIVIPALNEEEGIQWTMQALPKDELETMGYQVQILVVDNNSDDATAELASKAGAEVVFEQKRGYGRAYKTGFASAKGDIIVTTDADATYPLEDIPKLVEMLERENLDFLTTNRLDMIAKGAMPFRKRMGNAILSLTMRILFNLGIKDSQSGMWVFKRSVLDNLVLRSDNAAYSQELKIEACHFAKYRWREVPIKYESRIAEAKLGGWKVGFGNLLHLIKKRITR